MSTSSYSLNTSQGSIGPLLAGSIRELSYGMSGEDVRHLQRMLNQCLTPSPNLIVDGIFGYKTELAVLRFQTGAGLVADAIVGHKTWAALDHAAPSHQDHPHVEPKNGNGVSKIHHKPAKSSPQTGGGKPVHSHHVVHGNELVSRGGKYVPHYCQGDPRWCGMSLNGCSGSSIGRYGCAIASVAMVLRYYGRNVDPGTLNQWLTTHHGYSGTAVNWQAAFQAHGREGQSLAVVNPMFGDRRQFRSMLYRRIEKNIPTIVDIDYGESQNGVGNHYVVVVGRNTDGSLIMNDPAYPGGNGVLHPDHENLIEKTSRRGGYHIVSLCLVNPA